MRAAAPHLHGRHREGREERHLVTAEKKIAEALGLTLAGLLLKSERDADDP